MKTAEAKRIMEIYKARENGIDFAIKIMELIDDGEEKPNAVKETVRKEKKKTKEPRTCPKCGRPIMGRGNKKVCDECKAKKADPSDDLRATAKELARLAR